MPRSGVSGWVQPLHWAKKTLTMFCRIDTAVAMFTDTPTSLGSRYKGRWAEGRVVGGSAVELSVEWLRVRPLCLGLRGGGWGLEVGGW